MNQFDRYYLSLSEKYNVPLEEDMKDTAKALAAAGLITGAGLPWTGPMMKDVANKLSGRDANPPAAKIQPAQQIQPAQPAQPSQVAHTPLHYNRLSQYLKRVENSPAVRHKTGGYDPETKTFKPYGSAEGGTMTVGYGHKFPTVADRQAHEKAYPNGMTEQQAHELLLQDIKKHEAAAMRYVGQDKWKKLDDTQKEMLIDMDFNPGIEKFPTFTKAVLEKDRKTALAQYKRYMGSKKNPLTDRNNVFYEIYLKNFAVSK